MLAATGGCTSLAERIAVPDDDQVFDFGVNMEKFREVLDVSQHRLRTDEGVVLAWQTVPVVERGIYYEFTRDAEGDIDLTLGSARKQPPEPLTEQGSIVFLHGWDMNGTSMLPWALIMAERGYRGIVVDLRGHGASSDAPVGYGRREAHDVVALLDTLAERGELPRPVYLFGVSYGASTALFAEAELRERIAGVIAMEPYANAAAGIRSTVAGMLEYEPEGLRARIVRSYMRWRYDATDIEYAIVQAGERLELDLHEVDVAAALANTRTCTLLLHGADDRFIPVEVARTLAKASPLVRYVEVPGEGHLSLPLRIDWLAAPVVGWMQAVATGECAAFVLPARPEGG